MSSVPIRSSWPTLPPTTWPGVCDDRGDPAPGDEGGPAPDPAADAAPCCAETGRGLGTQPRRPPVINGPAARALVIDDTRGGKRRVEW